MPFVIGEVTHLNRLPTRPFQMPLNRAVEGVLKGCEVVRMGSGNYGSYVFGTATTGAALVIAGLFQYPLRVVCIWNLLAWLSWLQHYQRFSTLYGSYVFGTFWVLMPLISFFRFSTLYGSYVFGTVENHSERPDNQSFSTLYGSYVFGTTASTNNRQCC